MSNKKLTANLLLELDNSHVYNQQDVVSIVRKKSFMKIGSVKTLLKTVPTPATKTGHCVRKNTTDLLQVVNFTGLLQLVICSLVTTC